MWPMNIRSYEALNICFLTGLTWGLLGLSWELEPQLHQSVFICKNPLHAHQQEPALRPSARNRSAYICGNICLLFLFSMHFPNH